MLEKRKKKKKKKEKEKSYYWKVSGRFWFIDYTYNNKIQLNNGWNAQKKKNPNFFWIAKSYLFILQKNISIIIPY
jgi:hypothetical protein